MPEKYHRIFNNVAYGFLGLTLEQKVYQGLAHALCRSNYFAIYPEYNFDGHNFECYLTTLKTLNQDNLTFWIS